MLKYCFLISTGALSKKASIPGFAVMVSKKTGNAKIFKKKSVIELPEYWLYAILVLVESGIAGIAPKMLNKEENEGGVEWVLDLGIKRGGMIVFYASYRKSNEANKIKKGIELENGNVDFRNNKI